MYYFGHMQSAYIYLAIIIFFMNLAPAFAPPTWTILVLFKLNSDLDSIPLVALGALSAASGRYCLALLSGLLREKFSAKQQYNLESAGIYLERRATQKILGLGLFALSPLPSAQLFEAAGFLKLRLIPFTTAFFMGRLVSYSIYVTGATVLKEKGVGDIFLNSLKSPWGIAIQLLSLLGIYYLTKIDWVALEAKRESR